MGIKAGSIEEYFVSAADREPALRQLHGIIAETIPSLRPAIFSGMSMTAIGYGMFHYKYASGREGDWPVVMLANQRHYISLYICLAKDGKYLAEAYAHILGKVNCGRSCIRFKKIADLNLATVRKVLKEAEALSKDPKNFQF